MKKIIQLLVLTFCCFISYEKTFASHAAGAELVYELVPGTTNEYKFTYKLYRDCDGIAAPTTMIMCYNSNCGATGQLTMNAVSTLPNGTTNGSPVGTGCPGFPTTCTGGALPGYQEWWYTVNFIIPNTCNYWLFSVSINARNTAIVNLNNPGAQSLYVEAVFDNTVSQNNSSPYFSNPPIPYCCVNQLFNYNNGTIDPDGDSLFFESIQPRTSAGCTTAPTNIAYAIGTPVPFSPPLTTLNPFPCTTPFTVNSSTGAISFTAAITGAFVITIKVSEYRNGTLIGTVMRDLQIVVQNCTTPSPTYGIDSLTIVNGNLVAGVVQGCATDTLSFCFDITSTSPSAILVPYDNSVVSLPGAVITYTGVQTDSIRACVSWLTTLADTGLHILTITVKDSSCAPPGILISNTFSIPIHINPVTVACADTSVCIPDSAQLFVGGGSIFHWTVLPGGSDTTSMSCTYCDSPKVAPSVTTTYVVTSDLASICPKSTDTVTVFVATGPALTITPDTVTCINANLQLNVSALPTTQPYNYSWSPSTFLNDATIANPIMQLPNTNTTYTVTVVPQGILACSSTATVNVEVLKGYNLLNHDTVICNGSTVSVVASGGNPKYTYLWSPSTYISNPSILSPTITPTTPGVYNYFFTASKIGCPDSTQDLTITVNPIPVLNAGVDRELCLGDSVHLESSVTPPGNPSYVYTWSPASDLSDPSVSNPVFDGVTNTLLTLVVEDSIGCSDTDLVLMTVNPSNFLQVSGDKSICPNDSTTLSVAGGVSYLWHPTLYVSDSTASSITVYPISTQLFTVYGYDIKGCLDSATTTVVVHPGAIVDAGQNHTIYPGETAQLYADGNCSYYSWFPPNGLSATNIKNPLAQPSVTTRYFVTAQTEAGCSSSDSVDVIVVTESLLDLPNAFSPGSGTSSNDELKIIVKGIVKLNSFKIFNRWGQEVFSSTDINKGWNGQYNGKPQPMGTYVYVFDAVSNSGKRFYKQGNVTLIR